MPENDTTDDLARDHALLKEAVGDAGALAGSLFGSDVKHRQKSDNSPVSDADLAVNDLLKERLCGPRPDYGWMSEESADTSDRLTRDRVWVVDPIDGTRAFLTGKPQWTIAVALVEDGRPVLAAVYNPVTAEFFDARKGHGAMLNDTPVQVEDRDTLAGARVLANAGVFTRKGWPQPWPEMTTDFRISMAYRLCGVASGAYHATLAFSAKSDWDLAAADLLVCEAGGVVTDRSGAPFTYNKSETRHRSVLAAGPSLHQCFLQRTRGPNPWDNAP